MNSLLKILVLFFSFCVINHAEAARPMLTDDARIVDPKSCQLESWVRDSKHVTEYWALPACNVGENLEAQLEEVLKMRTVTQVLRMSSIKLNLFSNLSLLIKQVFQLFWVMEETPKGQ
jgi:hypothetical protein